VKQKAAAGLILRGPVDQAMKRVFATGDPAIMRSLRNTVLKDPTALQGLKAAFGEELLRRAKTGGRDLVDEAIFSGTTLRNEFNTVQKMARELFSKKELARIDTVINTFEKLDRTRRAGRLAGPLLTDKPSKVLNVMARVFAARVGGKLGSESAGGSLQTAQIFSGEAKEQLSRITTKDAGTVLVAAIENEELFQSLLIEINKASPKQVRSVLDRIRPFLAVPATTAIEAEREDEGNVAQDIFGVNF